MRRLADGLWTHEHVHTIAGSELVTRMNVVRLPSRGLLLWSPVPIDDPLAERLRELGPVEAMLAPSRMHHVYLGAAHERYPDAAVYGPPGLPRKRSDLRFSDVIASEVPQAWRPDLEVRLLEGAPIASELALYHRPTRSLMLCDWCFNIHHPRGRFSALYLRLNGALGQLAQTWLIKALIRDRAAARTSMERVLDWDFERLLVAHGEIIEGPAARDEFSRAIGWLRPHLPT